MEAALLVSSDGFQRTNAANARHQFGKRGLVAPAAVRATAAFDATSRKKREKLQAAKSVGPTLQRLKRRSLVKHRESGISSKLATKLIKE
jgi:hypothetical protein